MDWRAILRRILRHLIDITRIHALREKAGFTAGQRDNLCAKLTHTGDQDKSGENTAYIIDYWPDKVPITPQELEVVDQFLDPLLDVFFFSLSQSRVRGVTKSINVAL